MHRRNTIAPALLHMLDVPGVHLPVRLKSADGADPMGDGNAGGYRQR